MSFPRIAGIAGIAFFVLMVLSTIVPGEPPALDADDQEVVEFITEDTGTVEVGSILGMLGLPLFAVLAVGLARTAAPEGATDARAWAVIGTVGAAGTIGTVGMASGINGVLLAQADSLEDTPEVAGLLFDLANAGFVAAAVLFGIYLLGMGMAIVRGATLPAWLGWAGVVIAAFGIIGGAFAHEALANEGIGFLGFIGFIGFVIWNLAAGVVLLMRSRAPTPAAAAA